LGLPTNPELRTKFTSETGQILPRPPRAGQFKEALSNIKG